ncbi:hypothetical protein [Paenibacillus taichungensis]|uniref:hypothetical protein n=1 Tax=Paenibacillus taichungensis TaxID=484184 RepID=UPI0039A3B1F2
MSRLEQLKSEYDLLVCFLQQNKNISDELYEDITKVKEKRVKEMAQIYQQQRL